MRPRELARHEATRAARKYDSAGQFSRASVSQLHSRNSDCTMKTFELDSGPQAAGNDLPVLQVGPPRTVTAGTDNLKKAVVLKRIQIKYKICFLHVTGGHSV